MTDPGLTKRLRQHSRRSGFMVGLTMALTIALCILGFTWVFIRLEPYVSDFVSREQSSAQEQDAPGGSADNQGSQQQAEAEPTEDDSNQPPPERPQPTRTPTPKPNPTATSTSFSPDYQITAEESVNLRQGPGTNTDIIVSLSIATPLQYLGETIESDDPARDNLDPGQSWMKFRTENGDEGWVREIDVGPYQD